MARRLHSSARMPVDCTILIAARNAAATIDLAVASCLPEEDCPLVLVDDQCTDDTVGRAVSVAGPRLRVVRAPDPGGIGAARQAGLDAVETPFAAWLDADDQWIVGRADRLSALLRAGHDVATESIALHDGASGAYLRTLSAPAFLRRPGGSVRLFERNFLPGDTQVAFRTQVYRDAGGYDAAIHGPESFDLLLRAVRGGARLAFGDEIGYRMHAYPSSVSRQIPRQRAALALALRKHRYSDARTLFERAGYQPRVAAWALVSMALYREEYEAALHFLDEASPKVADAAHVLEPDGPWPFPEGWRRAFHRGTLLLLLGERGAVSQLDRAEAMQPTAVTANNLGVALWRAGERGAARRCFARASDRWPGYLDARINGDAPEPGCITTHPPRQHASRAEYPASSTALTPAQAASTESLVDHHQRSRPCLT